MKKPPSFQLHEFSRRAENLLELVREELAASSLKEVRGLASQLPNQAMEQGAESAPFTLAFVGQYGAGKSSLLAALTGNPTRLVTTTRQAMLRA
jgi:tRNA U34 5-carboxymethylaminomethyl modifying GTPase MnmE/TrmE